MGCPTYEACGTGGDFLEPLTLELHHTTALSVLVALAGLCGCGALAARLASTRGLPSALLAALRCRDSVLAQHTAGACGVPMHMLWSPSMEQDISPFCINGTQ